MESQKNLCSQPLRKPRTPQQPRNTITNKSEFANEYLKKGNSVAVKNATTKEGFKVELLPKTEELSGKKRRPNTTSGGRRKPEIGDKERSPRIPMSKSFSLQSKNINLDQRSIVSASSTPPSTSPKVKKQCLSKNKAKSPAKNNYKIDCTEEIASTSLFAQAVHEHEQIIELLCVMRKELRNKMVEKIKSRTTAKTDSTGSLSLTLPNFINFENSYGGTLEEIFQAWVNLFYFIINLKINFIHVLNSASTESFRPNCEVEREVVGQAIESVKFFSKLKIYSLVNSLEELRLPDDHNVTEAQIKDYEERVSSPFLFEMGFMQKKAKEILEQAKKAKNT